MSGMLHCCCIPRTNQSRVDVSGMLRHFSRIMSEPVVNASSLFNVLITTVPGSAEMAELDIGGSDNDQLSISKLVSK